MQHLINMQIDGFYRRLTLQLVHCVAYMYGAECAQTVGSAYAVRLPHLQHMELWAVVATLPSTQNTVKPQSIKQPL